MGKKELNKKELNRKQKTMLKFAHYAGADLIEDNENVYLKTDIFDKNNLPLLSGYCEVELDDNKISLRQDVYSIQKGKNYYYNYNEYIKKVVTINLEEEKNLITVKQEEKHSVDYMVDEVMGGDYAIFNVISHQKVTEFRADDNCLKVFSANIDQMAREDTDGMCEAGCPVVDFNSIKDFDCVAEFNSGKNYEMDRRLKSLKFDSANHSIPEGYRIIDCAYFLKNNKVKSFS